MSFCDQTRPRVSAIIPAYNGEAFVADAIESVLAQTLPVSEIIVVDDGSTDNTAGVAKRYASRGVRCIRQENQGPSGARNRGVAETTGELIAFLDCDDTWLPDKTALQVEYLMTRPRVGLVGGHAWWWNPQTGERWIERGGGAPNANVWRELMVYNCVGTPSGVMVRRRALEEVGDFDPRHRWAEDWHLWVRVGSRWRIGVVDRPLFVYRLVPTSLTQRDRWEHANQSLERSREFIARFSPPLWRPILLARAWSRREHSRAILALHDRALRRQYLWHAFRALVSYPFDDGWTKLKHLVRALVGESLYRAFKARTEPRAVAMPAGIAKGSSGLNPVDARVQPLR